jgi:hypothetical protein
MCVLFNLKAGRGAYKSQKNLLGRKRELLSRLTSLIASIWVPPFSVTTSNHVYDIPYKVQHMYLLVLYAFP